jgi:hypothetical protein
MTGYVRKDTTNNIADGNVINAADLDSEFDGVQDAFNASTGHKHDGTAGEGATINALGPTQDVTVSATLLAPKTTNTVDIGSSALKFKDLFLAGNASVGGTLAVTGVATLGAGAILNTPASVTLTNATGLPIATGVSGLGTGIATFLATPSSANLIAAVTNETGTGSLVFATSPTLVTPVLGAATGTSFQGIIGNVTPAAGAFTTVDASGAVTLSGGTANGVNYLNGSKVLTSGSALTFDGTTLGTGAISATDNLTITKPTGVPRVAIVATTGTNEAYFQAVNTGGSYYFGAENSTGSWFGANPYALSILAPAGKEICNLIGGVKVTTLTSSSLYTASGINVGIGVSAVTNKLTIGTGTFATPASGTAGLYATTAAGLVVIADGFTVASRVGTDFLKVDSSGNLGLGVTPSAWFSSYKALQLGSGAAIQGSNNVSRMGLGANWLSDSAGNDKYIGTGFSTVYAQLSGVHSWYNAPSGTAGDTISFTQAMTLDASGNLAIGTTSSLSSAYRITSAGGRVALTGNSDGLNLYMRYDAGTAGAFIGSPAANTFAISDSNGTERARIDSSGNFGLGAAPSAWGAGSKALQINSNLSLWSQSSTNNYVYANAYFDGTNDKYVSTAEAARIRFAGATTIFNYAASGSANANITWQESFRTDTSGNLLVGKTSSGAANVGFEVNQTGISYLSNSATTDATSTNHIYSTGASAFRFYVGMGGTVFATSIVISAISDQRLKENVRDIDTGLDAIMALQPRRFDWKDGKGQDKKNVAGFIAQEFETVFPECVGVSKAGADGIEYKNINHETLIPTLVKAMQEQQAIIESLKARLDAANL